MKNVQVGAPGSAGRVSLFALFVRSLVHFFLRLVDQRRQAFSMKMKRTARQKL
jgi:hypothetical protein